jgi:Skp family chaperone for outer membrane proteins
MKRYLVLLFTIGALLTASAQTRGLKIAYIDMEYILDKVPSYAETKNQLEQRAAKWKQEMDAKKGEITRLKESLHAEKALLTKELIEEREEEIALQEKELSDYQEKKFGPKGELITQKTVLVKPIQDQIFTIVQDIAAVRKLDFVFDKSSDLTMLFAAKKYDISELIVKRLSRSAKQEKMNSKQAKQLEAQEKQDEIDSDPDVADRRKLQEERKAARQKLLDDRKAASDAKRQVAQEARAKKIQEREDAKNAKATGVAPKTTAKPATDKNANATDGVDGDDDAPANTDKPASTEKPVSTAAADKEAARQAAIDARNEKIKARQEALQKKREEDKARRDSINKARADKKAEKATPKPADDPTSGDD